MAKKTKIKKNKLSKASDPAAIIDATSGAIACIETIESMIVDSDRRVTPPSGKIPQTMVAAYDMLGKIESVAKKLRDSVKESLLACRTAKIPVEPGALDIIYKSNLRRSPAWKDIAVENAEALAKVKKKTFSAELFIKEVQEKAIETISYSVEIVRKED